MQLRDYKFAQTRLAVSRTTLYNLIRAGQIQTVKIGKRGSRITDEELERFVKQRSSGANQEGN